MRVESPNGRPSKSRSLFTSAGASGSRACGGAGRWRLGSATRAGAGLGSARGDDFIENLGLYNAVIRLGRTGHRQNGRQDEGPTHDLFLWVGSWLGHIAASDRIQTVQMLRERKRCGTPRSIILSRPRSPSPQEPAGSVGGGDLRIVPRQIQPGLTGVAWSAVVSPNIASRSRQVMRRNSDRPGNNSGIVGNGRTG